MTLLELYEVFLFDLDGVLYRGDQAVPDARDGVASVREAGGRPIFATNNSSRTPEEVAGKLRGLGIEAAPSEVVTSALATADLVLESEAKTAFVIGERGIREALERAGITLLGGMPERTDLVIVGWDRSIDYAKLKAACLLVERGARLIATNADPSYPAPDGNWPGAGALLAAVTTATGATAEVIGKPHAPLFRAALARAGDGRALVVGDRLDTDVAGAEALGLDSLLVLTGISTRRDLERSPVQPTFLAADLSALSEPGLRPLGTTPGG